MFNKEKEQMPAREDSPNTWHQRGKNSNSSVSPADEEQESNDFLFIF